MGTKVQCKSVLPGYHSMRNINDETNSSWARYYEDRTLNGQFCNGFTPRPLDGYLDYDKEALKQTMLRQEEIFRKQVLELHRLYKRQRDLMEELKRNGEQNFSVQVKSSESSPFSTQMLPKVMESSWQVHGFPSTGASCSRTPISGVDSKAHSSSLNGSSFLADLTSRENGSSQVNQLLDSRIKKFPRKMLDLELPADVYVDTEDADHAEEKNINRLLFESTDPSKRRHGFQPENNVKLTLGTSQDPCSRVKTQKSSSGLQNGLQPHLADLNVPLKDVSCEEMATSSSNFLVQMTCSQGPQRHQKSTESVSSFRGLCKDAFQDRHNVDGSVSMHMESGGKGQKQPYFNNEIGQSNSHMNSFTSGVGNKNVRQWSETVPINPSKAQDFSSIFPPRQDRAESWFREKQCHGIELSHGSHDTVNRVFPGLMVPTMRSPLYASPAVDYPIIASPAASSWKKPSNSISHMPTAVQAFPFFGVSTPVNIQSTSSHNLENASGKWQCNRDFKSTPNFGGETHFYPNSLSHSFQFESSAPSSVHLSPTGFNKPNFNNGASPSYEKSDGHGHQMSLNGLHCMDVKPAKGAVNLNLAPPNGFHNGFAPKAKVLSGIEGKKEGLSGGISCLRTKLPSSELTRAQKGVLQELASVHGHCQPMPSYCSSAREVEQRPEAEVSSSLEVLQEPSLVLKPKGTKIQQNEAAVTSSKDRVLDFSVPQGTQQCDISFTSVSHQKISLDDDEVEDRAKEGILPADSFNYSKPLDLERQIHMEQVPEKNTPETVKCFRAHINLNFIATSDDQLKSSESTSEDETELPSPPSVWCAATRFAPEIDLEAPPASPEEEQAPWSEPVPQINQLVQLVEPEGREDCLQATETIDETLARNAAETIQLFSLSRTIHLENPDCHPLALASADTLHWFADLITSNGDNLGNAEAPNCKGDADLESLDISHMDYFEYMTMNLTETRIDEHFCRPIEPEIPEEDETGVAHLLLTRPRRGQARRRRQRRDFQRDILPGLASLSRQEITEDMQMIGGLMRASGQPWRAGSARRNAGRNRARRQAKGGRRPRSTPATAAAVAEAPESPQPRQPSKEGTALDGGSILGWGRTTKRCRRQRCPPSNT